MGTTQIPLKMSNLQWMMNQGTTFTNTISNSPLCVPARACLATGLSYKHCKVWNNEFCLPVNQQTFYQTLKNGGYQVGGVGKFDLHKPVMYWGKDGWIDQLGQLGFSQAIDNEGKFDLLWSSFYDSKGPYSSFLRENGVFDVHIRDYVRRYFESGNCTPTPLSDFEYADNWVTRNAKGMLEELTTKDNPWFMMVNFSGPHNPWDITQSMKDACQSMEFSQPYGYTGDKKHINTIRQNYGAMLENIDRNIGNLIEFLKEKGQYDNTILIYSSDHGEMLGDKDRFYKSVPYRGSVNIPLIISGPGVEKNQLCNTNAQLHDLAATILDFADMKFERETDSISLKSLAQGSADGQIRDYQLSALHNSQQHKGVYEDYEEYAQYQKRQGVSAKHMERFKAEMNLTAGDPINKYNFGKNWDCIIFEDYKLIMYDTGKLELYDVIHDPYELEDISLENPQVVERLKEKYLQVS